MPAAQSAHSPIMHRLHWTPLSGKWSPIVLEESLGLRASDGQTRAVSLDSLSEDAETRVDVQHRVHLRELRKTRKQPSELRDEYSLTVDFAGLIEVSDLKFGLSCDRPDPDEDRTTRGACCRSGGAASRSF
jgi:hypothetical protein